MRMKSSEWLLSVSIKAMSKQLAKVTTDDLVQWRDSRLKEVQGATVRREANILASLFTVARKEWKWIKESPMADLTLPPPSKHRDRRITQDEIDRLCLAANWDNNVPVNSTQQIIIAFLLQSKLQCVLVRLLA